MRYSVAELDAMPVGTALSCNGLPIFARIPDMFGRTKDRATGKVTTGEVHWYAIMEGELYGACHHAYVAQFNFTHRADPQTIDPQPAPAQPCAAKEDGDAV